MVRDEIFPFFADFVDQSRYPVGMTRRKHSMSPNEFTSDLCAKAMMLSLLFNESEMEKANGV